MNHISIYLSNARLTPSSYYRLTQYFALTGATIHSTLPDRIYTWWHNEGKNGPYAFKIFLYLIYVFRTLWFLLQDLHTIQDGIIIISRVIVPRHMPFLHKFLIKRLAKRNQIIWDFDDNILENKSISHADFRFFSEYSNRIVVTNDFLASLIDSKYKAKAIVLPTTDGDMLSFEPATMMAQRQLLYNKEIRLIWVATATGLDYLKPIIPELDEAAKLLKERNGKKLCLHVVCNKPLRAATNHLEIVNIAWEREKAKQEISKAHIGLMPLPDTAFTRGKGGFKLIQYMSASMPVIASDVGFNQQVVKDNVGYLINDERTEKTWKDAILELSSDWENYNRISKNAKKHYDTFFSYKENKEFWDNITYKRPKLLMVVNEDRFFLSHRKDIALAAQEKGWEVSIVCKDTGRKKEVEALGLKMIELPINPTGTNILQEIKTFHFLFNLYRKDRQVVVHHVGLKNILWGGLAAKLTKVKSVVNAVSGLGVVFSEDSSSLISKGILLILRFSHHRKGVHVIFQNHEDEKLFLQNHIIKSEQIVFIKGSGVDLNEYRYTPEQGDDIIKVLFTARMVKEKGVIVLVNAAEQLRKEYEGRVEFWLCGGLSNNPKAIKQAELERMCDGHYIKWFGYRDDVRQLLAHSHIMAFPSYYREGVPKSLIEACAIGRPIVTTNSIGCRDTVEDGINGFLIPIKDSKTLAQRLKKLIDDKELRDAMGKASRQKAEREFSIENVIKKHLEVYAI